MDRHREKGYKPVRLMEHPMGDENWPYNGHPSGPNDRQFGYNAPKFERHIYIRRDQVFHDLDAQLLMIAKMRRKADGTEDDTFTNATSDYHGQFLRWIDKHMGIAKGVMSAFTLDRFHAQKFNSISNVEEVDIELLMPEYWDDTVFDQLVSSVHDYITNSVLYEYLLLTLTTKDPVTVDKQGQSQKAFLDIKHYVNAAKPGRIHKTLQLF